MIPETMPDLAVLDGDIIAYKAACVADRDGLDDAQLKARLEFDYNYWVPEGCTNAVIAFSCSRTDNYRRDFWPEYKAKRGESPASLKRCRDLLGEIGTVAVRPRLEADDILGLAMSAGLAVGVSLDKDMRTVPGWYWNPDKMNFPVKVDEEEADLFFAKQWLMGDSTDNIPGIYNFGPKKADAYLDGIRHSNLYAACYAKYDEKEYDEEYTLSQARCVRILRDGEWDIDAQKPILFDPFGD